MTSLADYNNNPGNLRPPKNLTYEGQIGVDEKGFAIFKDGNAGRNALIQDIRAKQKQGLNTPHSFIDKYTPAMGENPEDARDNYKIRMAQHLGLKSTTDPFPEGSEQKIADLIASVEGGQPVQKEPEDGEEKPPPFVPVADTFPPKTEEDNKPPPTPAGDVVSPGAGALTGALASTVGQYPFTAELQTVKPPPDLDAAEKAAGKAQRQFEIAEQRLNQRVNSGRPITGGSHLVILEDEYKRSQAALQLAEKQLQDAVAAQKAKVAPAPPVVAANAPAAGSMASATPQIITDPNVPTADQHTRAIQGTTVDDVTGRARQTTYNERTSQIARNAANADQTLKALDEQGLIDRNKALALTEGISGSTPSGIKVAPDLAGETQNKAELEQKIVDDRAAQERLAQQQEMDRLKNEKILAAQQNSEAQRRFNEAQRAKTSGVTRAQTTMETAEDRARLLAEELDDARRAAKTAPGTAERVLQNTGAKVGKGSNIVKGGLGALGGYEAAKGINTLANLSLSDLQKRYDNGDRSPQLMDALKKAAEATVQVTAGTAAAMPAFGPTTSKIKGAGVLGTGALGAYQAWNALNKTAIERRKNPQQ